MMAGGGDSAKAGEGDGEGGFEWDDDSKLYFHTSSGFYHDPVSGWYYSSRDGLYYKWEDGNYVLLTCEKHDDTEDYQCKSSDNEVKALYTDQNSPDKSDFQCPPSQWLEDTLIDMYLSSYSNLEVNAGSSSTDLPKDRDNKGRTCSEELFDNFASDKSIPFQNDVTSPQVQIIKLLGENTQDAQESRNGIPGEANVSSEEERWLAQYGQVERENNKGQPSFPVVDLWDWEMVRETVKKRHSLARLVGRLASCSSKLHPSLPTGGGLLKTAAIREVHLDLVRVASGKVYRLRCPSRKYLASLSAYDSSNPTEDWGFPDIYACLQSKGLEMIQAHSISEAQDPTIGNISSMLNEFPDEVDEHQKLPYRDRAAERRRLHGCSTVGLAHGNITSFCEVGSPGSCSAAEVAIAEARNLSSGIGTYGRRIMESMGWKEGEALGNSRKGMLEPLQPVGNKGYAGLGWNQTRQNI